MKQAIFVAILITICRANQIQGAPDNFPVRGFAEISSLLGQFSEDSQISTDCGGVLENIAGVISYKFLEQLSPTEGCVWIVKPANKTSVFLRMVYSGFETNTIINVYTNANGELRHLGTLARTSQSATPFSGGVFFLQLSSNQPAIKPGSGFILSFDGFGTDTPSQPKYSQTILPLFSDEYRHPTNDGYYLQNEFSVFLLNSNPGRKINLSVKDVSIPTDNRVNYICQADVLNVYQFHHQQLYSRMRFCAEDVSSILTINSKYPVLITFYSVNRVLSGRDGFTLGWEYVDDVIGTTVMESSSIDISTTETESSSIDISTDEYW